jgi:hypothetical protein
MKYTYDITIFDNITTPEQAYWLGFIWSDGYVMRRERKSSVEYAMKLTLSKQDEEHLEKFVKFMKSNLPIHEYKTNSCYENSQNEVRVLINSTPFGIKLYHDFGIFPFRNDPSKTISRIPKELYKYFVMGILDADGSFSFYETLDRGRMQLKVAIGFQSVENLILFIRDYLYDNQLIESKQKYSKRHEGRDGDTFAYKICGIHQATKILDFMYTDSKILEFCIKRKYDKYKDLKEFIK